MRTTIGRMERKGKAETRIEDERPRGGRYDGLLTDAMAYQLRRASQVVSALWSQHSPDLTPPQFAVLQILDVSGPLDQGTLNARAAIDRSTSTPLLDRLIRLGWIMKEPDPRNRRRQIVQLTDAGRTRAMLGRAQAQQASKYFEDLLGSELATLTEILQTIGDAGSKEDSAREGSSGSSI